MKTMKTLVGAILTVAIAVTALVGCGNSSAAWKDGDYHAEYTSADEHGWNDNLDITVADGKITKAVFDSYDADGNKKSESADYDEAMKGAGSTTWPSDFLPKYSEALLEKQDAEKVDAIATATNSNTSLKDLFKALKKNMESGDTAAVKIDR